MNATTIYKYHKYDIIKSIAIREKRISVIFSKGNPYRYLSLVTWLTDGVSFDHGRECCSTLCETSLRFYKAEEAMNHTLYRQ